MAKGHWLDPLARSLLEATGQLRPRPRPEEPARSRTGIAGPPGSSGARTDEAIEQDLLALKLAQDPQRKLQNPAEVQRAAALGWRLDVNRATAADWLRLPGLAPAQVDLLLRLQAGGVQLSGPEDLQRLLELPADLVAGWTPLLEFRWYGDGAGTYPTGGGLDLNRVGPAELARRLPELSSERQQRLLRERQRGAYRDLADLQQRLQLPPAVVEALIGKVRFSPGPVGPELPRSA